jgi:hypothetical protein
MCGFNSKGVIMPEAIKYVFDGFKQGIIVGTPDFDENNQHLDAEKIGNDFKVSIKKVVGYSNVRKTKTRQTRSRKARAKA